SPLRVRDDEARLRQRLDDLRELAPVDAGELGVEARPARDAMDVRRDRRLRQRLQLVVRESDLVLDRTEDPEVPLLQLVVVARHAARVKYGPLVGEVLPRRQALRVVAGVRNLLLRFAPEHAA